MWRRAILVLALLHNISSQPISEGTENDQAPQYDFINCCPCPGSEFWEKLAAGQSLGDIQNGVSNLARASSDGANGCQCRDAEVSPSLLSPRTMIPVWTDIGPLGKEDGKTILHPEIDMASGVLETLREATDEEYREALARDAARSAAVAMDAARSAADARDAARSAADAMDAARSTEDGEDKPIVTIIVSHDDDAMPEASGTQEAHVAPPVDLKDSKEIGTVPLLLQPLHKILGKSTADVNERVKGLTKGLDSIMLGTASDIHERVAEINKGIEGLKLKEKPVLSLLPGKGKNNSLGNEHLKNILKINDLGSKLLKNAKENADSVIRLGPAKISGLKTPLLRRITPLSVSKQARDNADNSPASSNVNEQAIAEAPFGLTSLLPRKDTGLKGIKPLKLDDLLNLKDVELIPSKPLKLNLPALNLFPTSRSQKTEIKDSKKCEKVTPLSTDIHKTPDTEILDVVPSASEMKGATSKPTTNIIDNVLTADEKHESTRELGIESTETTKQIIQDQKSQKVQKYLDHGVEITISSDGNTEIENVSVEREFTPTKDESNEEVEAENAVPDEDDQENIEQDQSLAQEGEIDEDPTVNSPLENQSEGDNTMDDENSTVQEARDFGEEDVEFAETENSVEESSNSNGAFQFMSESEESENESFDTQNFEFRTQKPSAEDTEMVATEESTEMKYSDDILESNEGEEIQQQNSPNLNTNVDTSPKSVESFEVNSETSNEDKSAETKENELSQNSQSKIILPSIKERISIKLKTLQKPQTKVFTIARTESESEKQSTFSGEDENLGEPKKSDDFQSMESPDSFSHDNAAEKSSDITEKSTQSLENGEVTDTTTPANSTDTDEDDMSSSATFFKPTFVKVRKPETFKNSDIFLDEISEEHSDEQNERSSSSCGCNANALELDKDSNTGASLRQDVIVQPSSPLPFSGGSLFDRPILPALPALPELPPLPPLNLNARIPTLEDLNSRIANLLPLGGLGKEASNEEGSEECSNADPTVDASSKSSTSLLPPLRLRPQQDINLDIFRLNPLGSSGLKIPSLNLNTFKTKLALPEHLGLKPLELQHSFGNKKTGLLGAKLRFGPTTIGARDILGKPLGLEGLPNLDTMRDSMKVSASNFLKTPILPPPTLLGDGLPTIDKIADDLKFHAENLRAHHENTAQNIQDTLASTLSEVKLKTLGTTKTKYAHPQPESLVEKMAIAHDDLNDKLRGIHVDLQDRLTTLHDDILENAKLPILKLPTMSTMSPLARALGIEKSTPSKPRTSSSSRKDSTRKPGFKINKPSQTKGKSALSSSKLFNQDKTIRPFKLAKAASSLQPKTIEVPKLITTSSKPPFTQRLTTQNLRESNIFSTRKPTQRDNPLIKPFKPLGEVKITIGTTARPATKTNIKPTSRAAKLSTAKPRTKPVLRDREATTPRTSRPTLAQRLQSSRDSNGFASEVQPTRVLPSQPLQSQSRKSQQTSPSPKSSLITESPNKGLKTVKKTPVGSENQPLKQIAPKELVKKGLHFQHALKSASAKTTESPVLSKLREAIKARIASKSKAPETLVTPVRNSADQDMLRSASENNEIKVVEKNAMKENITYKCKMMCVRDP